MSGVIYRFLCVCVCFVYEQKNKYRFLPFSTLHSLQQHKHGDHFGSIFRSVTDALLPDIDQPPETVLSTSNSRVLQLQNVIFVLDHVVPQESAGLRPPIRIRTQSSSDFKQHHSEAVRIDLQIAEFDVNAKCESSKVLWWTSFWHAETRRGGTAGCRVSG